VPARAARSRSENGDDHDVAELSRRVDKLRQELRDLAPRIGRTVEPRDQDINRAYRCVSQLLMLIVDQVVPARPALARRSSLRSVRDLDRAVAAFQATAEQAQIVIHAFMETRENERHQRERQSRRNKKFIRDQLDLQQLRLQVKTELQALAEQSEDFLRVISAELG
jgi:hypothetical protein